MTRHAGAEETSPALRRTWWGCYATALLRVTQIQTRASHGYRLAHPLHVAIGEAYIAAIHMPPLIKMVG